MKFKTQEDKEMFTLLHPILIMVWADIVWYAKSKHNLDLVVTDTVSTPMKDVMIGRKEKSHQWRIALDWRLNDIKPSIAKDIIDYINNKPEYKQYHYLSRSGVTRLAYAHGKGANLHCHTAIHSKYKIIGLKSE